MTAPQILRIPADDNNLDEFASERQDGFVAPAALITIVDSGPPQQIPRVLVPLSRVEAAEAYSARRAKRVPIRNRSRAALARIRRTQSRWAALARKALNKASTGLGNLATTAGGDGLALCASILLRFDSIVAATDRLARGASDGRRNLTAAAKQFGGALLARSRAAAAGSGVTIAAMRRELAAAVEIKTVSRLQLLRWSARACKDAIAITAALARMCSRESARVTRVVWALNLWPQGPRRGLPVGLSRLEAEGAFVAIALGTVAMAFGGLLVASLRNSTAPISSPSMVARIATVEPTAGAAPHAIPPVAVVLTDRDQDARPFAVGVNASTLNAIWKRSDTRSLQHAFARLRQETLAFHRCTMQITATDRAIAHCDGVAGRGLPDSEARVRRVRWTLDFQRTGTIWAIQRVSNR